MSNPSPAVQELDEDLRLLFDGRTIGNGPASERVFGADEGVPRTVGESRDRYRKPIVEAFAASGAKTLVEFPERVRDLCERAALRDETRTDAARLLHERDRYKALAEQQSATVAEGAKTIGKVRAEMASLQRDMDILRSQWSAIRTAYRGTCDQLTEARRELEPMRVELADAKATIAKLTAEKRALKHNIRRLCRGFGKALAGDL